MDLLRESPILIGLIAFTASLMCGPYTIAQLRRFKLGQMVRGQGPGSHHRKAGTPSMGGVLIVASLTVALAISGWLSRSEPLLYAVFVCWGFAIIGFVDDLLKVLGRNSVGLRARNKLMAQLIVAGLPALYPILHPDLGTGIYLPFASEYLLVLHPILYFFLAVGVIIGTANAVNLTDGLDGLAAGSMAAAALAYGAVSLLVGAHDMAAFAAALVGACLGFVWFNIHPAQVFMGDTGSLGLGAALGAMALFTRTPLLLPIIGGLFVLETVSVILQVSYFRITKGRRIFRMTPLHHHFELTGWAETRVTQTFWLISLVLAAVGVFAMM